MDALIPILIVYFDLGEVLCHFSRERQAKALAALPGCGLSIQEILRLIEGSKQHLAYETGNVSRTEFLSWLAKSLRTTATLEQVEYAYATLFMPNEPMWQLARSLAKHYPLGIASNSDPSHFARVETDYPVLMSLFPQDRVVTSYRARARKASPAFFRHMTVVSGISPESILFIDDLLPNIDGAAAAKIGHPIHFTGSVPSLIAQLRARGVRLD
jgi:glucose-1-phosphatase